MGTADAQALLRRMEASGVRLQLEGEALRVNAPKGVLDAALRAELTANKQALIAVLRAGPSSGLKRAKREGRLPVSAAQQRLWFLDRIDPGNAAYNITGAVRLRGRLDLLALNHSLDDLISRHEALRTRIGEREGEPWLEVTEEARSQVEFHDLSQNLQGEAEATILRLANQLTRAGFDMARGPLSKLLLFRLADDHHVFVSSTHHIISDGWSMRLMLTEVFQLYQSRVAGTDAALATLNFSSIDHSAWEREQINSHAYDAGLAYWKQALNGAPALLELPTDRPRPAAPTFRGGRLARFIDISLIAQVKARAQQQNATVFMALMACWQAVLHRYSGQDDIVVGTPLANRDRLEFEGLIGCLINNVVIRGQVQDGSTLAQFLEQLRTRALLAYQHGQVPFDLIVEHLNPPRSASHAPVFQVLFTYLAFPVGLPPTQGLALEPMILDPVASRYDLTCEMSVDGFGEHANDQRISYEYSQDLFDETTIARLHDHFVQMLIAFVSDASQRIDEVRLELSSDDRRILLDLAPTSHHDRKLCVHQLLEASATRNPDSTALVVGEAAFSYAALNRRANQLARLLQSRGVKPQSLVAFCLDRTADIPTTMAAVLKAGAGYVPLDPAYPQERLRYVVEDSAATCVVTLRRFAALFDTTSAALVILDDAQEALEAFSDETLALDVDPCSRAYVIYTSGSTGRPKGVEVEHRNLVAFLDAMVREPGLQATDVLLSVTTPAFDISGLEIWLPLLQGAKIVMASRSDVIDGARLDELIRAHAVTVLQATPATWRMLIEAGWTGKADLKALCGGEALPQDLATKLLERVGQLWNMYGPTETTIWSTVSRVQAASGPITIGKPIANTTVRVLDAKGRQAPIGVVGELCIGGEGVSRGYLRRPELTAEKFVVLDSFGAGAERLYRTGDLARFRGDGNLVLIGRRDHQVKLRGYRIELGEIEAVLATHSGIRECVVIVREDNPGDQRLTAYVTTEVGIPFDADAAKQKLRQHLPDYMTPGSFVVLEALPLTPNGKIDRAALPRPVAVAPPTDAEYHEDLMNPGQRRVAQIWKVLLGVNHVGLNDNFFDAGGHSLLLVKLHAQLKAEFRIDLPLVELLQRTTVAAQAERMTAPAGASATLERARERAEKLARG